MTTASAARIVVAVVAQPLVPPDCTMRGLEYMPLMVDRLRGSRAWLACKRRPELAFYMLNLWAAAWRAEPAGSLEDDDDVLADAAMCDPTHWPEVRVAVMRGWLRCTADGRLYHPVVCEVVANAWASRTAFRNSTAKARAAKAAKRNRPPVSDQGDLALQADQMDQMDQVDPPQPARSKSENPLRDTSTDDASVLEVQPDAAAAPSDKDIPTAIEEEDQDKTGETPRTPPRAKKTRGIRLPDNWDPGVEGYRFAARFNLDPDALLAAFTDHYRGTAGIRGQSCDWHATWREWVRGADFRARRTGSVNRRDTPPPGSSMAECHERLREMATA